MRTAREEEAARVGRGALDVTLTRLGLPLAADCPEISFVHVGVPSPPGARFTKPGCAPIVFEFGVYLSFAIRPFYELVMTEVSEDTAGQVADAIERVLKSRVTLRRSRFSVKILMQEDDHEPWMRSTLWFPPRDRTPDVDTVYEPFAG